MDNNTSIYSVISYVETKGLNHAIRFEPATFNKFTTAYRNEPVVKEIIERIIKANNNCSFGTAYMIYSASWGSAQLMGFNIYGGEFYWDKTIFDYMASDAAQEAHFNKFLSANTLQDITPCELSKDSTLRLHFAIKYNGSIDYANAIVESLKHFGFDVLN
jgi:hypothetical protein